jgi:ribosome-binding protein aMBF1 (putative translation factor)
MRFPSRQRAIAAVIAHARRSAGLSQRRLSMALREPPNWIQRIESLERRVDVAEFIAIAKAVRLDPQVLLARIMRSSP